MDEKRITAQFVGWWADPLRNSDFEKFFIEDLRYSQKIDTADGEVEVFRDEDALWFIRQKPAWTDLEARIDSSDSRAVRMTGIGTDPVTGLRHTMRWKLTIEDEKISSVEEISSHLRG
jgi:hypothetical protein